MNRRFVSVFLFAVAVAGTASFLLYRLLSAQLSRTQKTAPSSKLLVATHDLQVGSLIKESDLQRVDWNGALPDATANKAAEVVGRGVIANIYTGEPISTKRLAAQGAGAGLASTIPVGMRAVAMKVDDVVGLCGFAVPGMRVDVVVSSSGGHAMQNDVTTRTLLQNIEVLSAGQHIEKSSEGKPDNVQVVNLLVTPDQAEVLSLVSNETKIQLVLRNPLDTKQQATHGASLTKLLGIEPVKETTYVPLAPRAKSQPVAKSSAPPTVEVFQGAKRTEQVVEGGAN